MLDFSNGLYQRMIVSMADAGAANELANLVNRVAVTPGTGAAGKALVLDANKALTLPSGAVLKGTGDGFTLGSAAAEKFAFHGAVPTAQRASADQEAVTPTTNIDGTDQVTKSGVLAAIQAVETLANELRATLVEKGLMLGEAAPEPD